MNTYININQKMYKILSWFFVLRLESLNDIITSIKLIILKRFLYDQNGSLPFSSQLSLEATLDQLIADKYRIYSNQ